MKVICRNVLYESPETAKLLNYGSEMARSKEKVHPPYKIEWYVSSVLTIVSFAFVYIRYDSDDKQKHVQQFHKTNQDEMYVQFRFKLLELNTNSSILAGRSAYTLIGTYELHSSGLQKLMEVGTIIGDKAYGVQYIADAPRFTDYLPTVQKMTDSLQIKSQPRNAK